MIQVYTIRLSDLYVERAREANEKPIFTILAILNYMQDKAPFLKTDTPDKKTTLPSSKQARPQLQRSKFWKRFTITMAILISILLMPTLIAILLATFLDPLYAWLLIPALGPLLIAGVLLVISVFVAIRFLLTQQPTENEQVLLGIFIVLTVVIVGSVLPSLSSL
jgi:uncharacterized membrane protein